MTLLTLSLLTPTASACGGFFCNREVPVKQNGETIVFEIDAAQNQTTMHVQVEYSGPPAEFAWVIPVRGEPDLALSNEALFSRLETTTRPIFQLDRDWNGVCSGFYGFWDVDDDGVSNVDPGVNVIAESQVGPYDTVVLQAASSDVLLEWLQNNGYSVPDAMGAALDPYIAEDHNFLALKLHPGQAIGDLEPLAMTYAGTTPSIPLQLTAVAAADDMPITTFVLGASRAVPQNYLHVEINEAAVDWFGYEDNYADVVTRAADQAGGHAFATDYSGSTEELRGSFYPEGLHPATFVASTAEGFIVAVTTSGLPASRDLQSTLERIIEIPEGVAARSVFNCPSCFSAELAASNPMFDAAAAYRVLEDDILAPLRAIEAMFTRQQHLTRLSSSVSPSEMTLDPMFTLNADIEQHVDRVHTATLLAICEEGDAWDEVPAQLVLPDGQLIELPSYQTLEEQGMYSYSDYMRQLHEPAASRIESLGSEGPAELLFDGRGEIRAAIDDLNTHTRSLNTESKSCSSVGVRGMAVSLLLPLLVLGRRRD